MTGRFLLNLKKVIVFIIINNLFKIYFARSGLWHRYARIFRHRILALPQANLPVLLHTCYDLIILKICSDIPGSMARSPQTRHSSSFTLLTKYSLSFVLKSNSVILSAISCSRASHFTLLSSSS